MEIRFTNTERSSDVKLSLDYKFWVPGRPVIFTDGSATAGVGCTGAWGWLLGYVGENNLMIERGHGSFVVGGTTGRMETKAVLDALEFHYARMSALRQQAVSLQTTLSSLAPPEFFLDPVIFCDSEFVVKALEPNGYMDRWEGNGFTKANGDEVANGDLMRTLSKVRKLQPFKIFHVRSHLAKAEAAAYAKQASRLLEVPEQIGQQIVYWNSVIDDEVHEMRVNRGHHSFPKPGQYVLPDRMVLG